MVKHRFSLYLEKAQIVVLFKERIPRVPAIQVCKAMILSKPASFLEQIRISVNKAATRMFDVQRRRPLIQYGSLVDECGSVGPSLRFKSMG